MHLNKEPFELMQSGKKSIEVRLNDEKRQEVIVGDEIEFSCDSKSITRTVVKVIKAGSFFDLFLNIHLAKLGRDGESVEELVERMYTYYSEEDEEKFGVVAFELI